MNESIVIVGASRTPIGAFQGELTSLDASGLGGHAIAAALKNAGIESNDTNEVIMGCCLPAGQGQAPARQAAFKAGLTDHVPATTLNKMCGSGMKAAMVAYDQLLAANGDIVIAGGMESMTNAPYLLPKMRSGARLGHGEVIDHMFMDGLEDAYDKGRLMGTFAEDCAQKYQFTRVAQDEFALRSLDNANKARASGVLDREITPITIKSRKGETTITSDESPRKAMPEKIPNLRPAFKKDGTVTAANASSISDGAAALVLMRESDAKRKGVNIRARILGHASHAQAPNWFTTAPVPAINNLLARISWSKDEVDLWEINEAFAVVPMAAQSELGIDRDQINIHGGACAVGHPIGASGARIMVTLLNALETRGKKKGIAAICIGGGEGTAVALELV